MQAIQVKYLGPTDSNGSRYKAVCQAGSITDNRDYALSDEADQKRVAELLVAKLKWNMEVIDAGVLKDGSRVFMVKYKEGDL